MPLDFGPVVLGGNVHELDEGDSIAYGPQTTTEYRNEGEEPARVMVLIDTSKAGGAS